MTNFKAIDAAGEGELRQARYRRRQRRNIAPRDRSRYDGETFAASGASNESRTRNAADRRRAGPGGGRVWISGYYRMLPRGGRIWVRGHYQESRR